MWTGRSQLSHRIQMGVAASYHVLLNQTDFDWLEISGPETPNSALLLLLLLASLLKVTELQKLENLPGNSKRIIEIQEIKNKL